MPDMIRLGPNPFENMPPKQRIESSAQGTGVELDKSWKSVAEMRRTLSALPPGVRLFLSDEMRQRAERCAGTCDKDTEKNLADLLSREQKETAKYLYGHLIRRYLEESLFMDERIAERLRRGEPPSSIQAEVSNEIARMFNDRKAPFVDAEHLEARCAETKAAVSKVYEHIAEHKAVMSEKSPAIQELKRKSHLPPYERELLKKFETLKRFVGESGLYGKSGHIGHLEDQALDMQRELKVLRKELGEAKDIEEVMSKNAVRFTSDDMADIWVGVASDIGARMERQLRGLRNLGQDKEAAAVQRRMLEVRSVVFEAALDWLSKNPGVKPQAKNKNIELLARRFNDVFLILQDTDDEPVPSRDANLQHAQIILRRLVRLSEAK